MVLRLASFLLVVFSLSPVFAEEPRTAKGIVVAAKSWDVAAPLNGKIAKIHFSEGLIVEKGDLLVSLDNRFKVLEVQLAEAALARAAAVLSQRQEVLERQEELKEREAVSLAALSEARHLVELAKSELMSAELSVQMAREVLAAHEIRAAISGVISAPRLNEGSYFDVAESGAIATIHKLDPINVRIILRPEIVLMRLQRQEFTIEQVNKLEFALSLPNGVKSSQRGKVSAVGFELDAETGEGSVLVTFPNPEGVLRPGLPVVLELVTD